MGQLLPDTRILFHGEINYQNSCDSNQRSNLLSQLRLFFLSPRRCTLCLSLNHIRVERELPFFPFAPSPLECSLNALLPARPSSSDVRQPVTAACAVDNVISVGPVSDLSAHEHEYRQHISINTHCNIQLLSLKSSQIKSNRPLIRHFILHHRVLGEG